MFNKDMIEKEKNLPVIFKSLLIALTNNGHHPVLLSEPIINKEDRKLVNLRTSNIVYRLKQKILSNIVLSIDKEILLEPSEDCFFHILFLISNLKNKDKKIMEEVVSNLLD